MLVYASSQSYLAQVLGYLLTIEGYIGKVGSQNIPVNVFHGLADPCDARSTQLCMQIVQCLGHGINSITHKMQVPLLSIPSLPAPFT